MQREVLKLSGHKNVPPKRKKVAAYARVSSGKDAMMHSLSAQVSYYSKLIQDNPNWQYCGVYADETQTGTKESRPEFQRLLEDSKQGKIDMIITKSISRFALNTLIILETVRELKKLGIDMYFEKENIHSLSEEGELMLTLLGSIAQEESLSVSENCKWLIRDKFKQGISTNFKMLGYKLKDNQITVIPKEAKIVKIIFQDYLSGMGINAIARKLRDKGIPTKDGGTWHENTFRKILKNEKYKGDALLQKCYTIDFLTKKRKKNKGEVPQYYVKNSHEAIISPEVYDLAQNELKNRAKGNFNHSCVSPFSSKIICGECGVFYGSKVWHSNDKYRKVIWQCNNKFKNKNKCKTLHLTEEQIEKEFVKAFNNLISNKDEVIKDCENTVLTRINTEDIDSKISKLQEESEIIVELMKNLIYENSRKVMNQDEYNKKYDSYTEKYEKIKSELSKLEDKKQDLKVRIDKIKMFIANLKNLNEVISEFDEKLWYAMVNKALAYANGNLYFQFKCNDHT